MQRPAPTEDQLRAYQRAVDGGPGTQVRVRYGRQGSRVYRVMQIVTGHIYIHDHENGNGFLKVVYPEDLR